MSSRIIKEENTEKNKRMEHIQGHSIRVILNHYNVYSLKKENNKEIIIGI